MPAPPPERPDEAWWSPADEEYVHGDKDAEGRLTGVIRYWTKDGAFIGTCEHVSGTHGQAFNYFSDGSVGEPPLTTGRVAGALFGRTPQDSILRCWISYLRALGEEDAAEEARKALHA